MEFPYVKCEGQRGFVYRPYVPLTFSYKGKYFRTRALVDTGSDFTILPLDMAHVLEIELDDSKGITVDCAGGATFEAYPSQHKIGYTLERKGFRSISWEGVAYFTETEPMVLLGHHQCLEKFDLSFRGPERVLAMLPRF